MRESVERLLFQNNNVDMLMRNKIDDFHLIEEAPMPVVIAGRLMFVGNLTLDNLYKFVDLSAEIFANVGAQITLADFLSNSVDMMGVISENKKLRYKLKVLIKKTVLNQQEFYRREMGRGIDAYVKLPKVSWRHFKKNVTLERLVQILFLIYKFNFDAVKKNFSILATAMGTNQISANYIYSWLQNLAGLTGKFIIPQYLKSGLSVNDSTNVSSEQDQQTAAGV